MQEKTYGGNKPSYVVIETQDGWIEIRTCHTNQTVRQILQRCSSNPRDLLRRKWEGPIRAEYWLGKVIGDFRRFFEQNRVRILFEPSRDSGGIGVTRSDVSESIAIDVLWNASLANPVSLFKTAVDEPRPSFRKFFDYIMPSPYWYLNRNVVI